LVFGFVPLLVYIISWGAKWTNMRGIFGVSCAATALTLFTLGPPGALQGQITRTGVLKSGVYMTINGGLATAAAYLLGWGLQQAVGNGC